MSFASVINSVIQNDAAVNSAVGSRIYSYNLPDNLDVKLSAIVFNYKKEGGTDTLDQKNILEDFSLYVVCMAQDTEKTESVAALVRALLDNYEDSNIRDITYTGDQNGEDQDKERYYKVLEYKVIFQE